MFFLENYAVLNVFYVNLSWLAAQMNALKLVIMCPYLSIFLAQQARFSDV